MKTLLFVVILSSALLAQVNLDSGLVAYYPFNGNANDQSGNDNHGQVTNAVLTSDRFGNPDAAYEFNGTNTFIQVPSSASLESPTVEIAQVAWVNTYSWSLTGTTFGPVLMKSAAPQNLFQYRLALTTSGVSVAFNNWNNNSVAPYNVVFDQWIMVASVFKDDTLKTFINDSLINSAFFDTDINVNDRTLEIGRDVPGVVEIFNGKIDDIYIYNRAITAQEVSAIYNGDRPTSIATGEGPITKTFHLHQNYPNPFNPSTTIEFYIPAASVVTLEIYDVLGRQVVRAYRDRPLPVGTHEWQWNATDAAGNPLSSGVYLYQLRIDGRVSKVKKMVYLK